MSAPGGGPPLLAAWLEAQQSLARLAGAGKAFDPASGATLQHFAEQYRRVFAAAEPAPAAAAPAAGGAALERYRQAAERFSRLMTEVATDAGRRFAEALAHGGPDVPPITTWRELHALWIDCGEAAWSGVAHREDFAAAQAELLSALVGLGVPGRPA